MFRVASTELPTITYGFPFQNKTQLLTPYHDSGFTVSQPLQDGLAPGANATVQVQLAQPGPIVVDSGTQTIPWDGVTGLPLVIQSSAQGQGGGLTDTEAQQLQQTHDQTFITTLLDQLTLIPLSSGPSAGPLNANLGGWIWGVIVRIASVPPDLVADTPDGDYWFPSLAVVRLFRGADLWKRVPIHTSSKIVAFATEDVVGGIAAATLTQWLLQMSVQVTFRAGVTGEVFLMRQP